MNFINSARVMAVGMPITVRHCTTVATASNIVNSHPNKNSHTCMRTDVPFTRRCCSARTASRPPSSGAAQLAFKPHMSCLLVANQPRHGGTFAKRPQDASNNGCFKRHWEDTGEDPMVGAMQVPHLRHVREVYIA